jgi:hypothetical protein
MPGSSEPGVPHDNLELIVIAITGRDSTGRGGRVRYDTSAVDSVMVGEAPATAAPAAESGSGVVSPPPWAASATRSWGPPPLEPQDVDVMSEFGTLQHTSKGQETWAMIEKEKGKNCNKCKSYHRKP